ncbi:glucose 1-dehydrogenase [Oceanicella actignis]|uniref:3-oxoacyl-[acyl-carrier protein] reductase n=1 Tax=Oceanicella actignis TaxID=1189325 RepID=A0A1M7RWG9_9RHOB|nr:glucose 1-dehydrogenase [Oceanicella actignis]SES99628.1 3-oxoacyl-[acyl-carrier protein] reductase [Oceanicella actignis]SHN50625.1 3-oxoacyl-[acyl-carrier protein] reductase [Oceanicella actignis]
MRLKDKRCIVTGGASGFGLGIARRFVEEGARVAILDIREDAAREAAEQMGEAALPLWCDVSDRTAVEAATASVEAAFGGIDVLVNNAGWTHRNKPVLEVTEDEFDRLFAVNVKSIYHFTRAVAPIWRAQGGGVMLNIGSTAGIRPRPGLTWYNATKAAANLATRSLALELAPDKVRVNALAPVAGETPLLASFMGEDTPERRAAFLATVPLGRFSTPRDVANAALWLCSDEAEFITGVVLEVDGGRTI